MTSTAQDISTHTTAHEALLRAVELAGHAPSLFNAQPWSWRLGTETADLYMEPAQGFPVTDPDNREMMIGCGAALHHLRVALAAAGWRAELLPSSQRSGGAVARVRILEEAVPDFEAIRLCEAIPRRRTDRRPFAQRTVGSAVFADLQASVDSEDVHLQIVTGAQQRIWLSVLSAHAVELQTAQDGYAEELGRVTGSSQTGIPATGVPHVVSARHSDVALRDFELSDLGSLAIDESADEHPTWCILWTDRDDPEAWLTAGVALSKLLLSATAGGLSSGVQSQPIEIPMVRAQLNRTLLSNMGHAQALVRIGWPDSPTRLPMHPRRD